MLAEREDRLDEAESLLRRLVAVNPDWEDAAFRLGFLQLKKGKYADAARSFEICLQKQPTALEPLLNQALAYWKGGDLRAATTTYQKILALDPSHLDAMRALTAIAIERKDANDALAAHETFAAAGGRSAELSFNLGLLLQSLGDSASAVQLYRAALEVRPEFGEALLNLGHALKASGQEQEAKQAWSKAVEASLELAAKYFPR